MFNLIIFDLASLPAQLVAPKTFGSPYAVGGNYAAWCVELSKEWNVPVFVVKLFWTTCLFFLNSAGFVMCWDLLAMVSIASGIYLPEEWPAITHNIFGATSLNDLWGNRWHKINTVSAISCPSIRKS